MNILITVGQLLLGLSILVALHEFGHFLPAKLFGMRVEKFFLFFDAPYALFKKKIGDTVYGIGCLPFGGYVKISGMIDESLDKEQKERMSGPPEPWEFRAKPVWQRLIVMVGGVTVNLILGLAIYTMVLYVWGREYLPLENMAYGVDVGPLMEEQGFKDGDRIVAVEGHPDIRTIEDVSLAVLIDGARSITIDRDGVKKEIILSEDVQDKVLNNADKTIFQPRIPFRVESALPGDNAAKTGSFRKGDRIVAVNGKPTLYFQDFVDALQTQKGQTIEVTSLREGHEVVIPVRVDDEGRVGLYPQKLKDLLTVKTVRYGLIASIPAGVSHGWARMMDNVSSFKLLGRKSGLKQMGGLGSMAKAYGPRWDWQHFWEMTAFLSLALAFLNILPIPALDGGHVVFLLYEAIVRRPANQKVLEYAQLAGMAFIVTVIVAVNGHDLFKMITGQ